MFTTIKSVIIIVYLFSVLTLTVSRHATAFQIIFFYFHFIFQLPLQSVYIYATQSGHRLLPSHNIAPWTLTSLLIYFVDSEATKACWLIYCKTRLDALGHVMGHTKWCGSISICQRLISVFLPSSGIKCIFGHDQWEHQYKRSYYYSHLQ